MGGGDAAMGRVTGHSGDGGIDGTIREDALGLDEVYLQAKKYAAGNTVGENALRNFAGAIDAAGHEQGRVCHHLRLHNRRQGLCDAKSEAHCPD